MHANMSGTTIWTALRKNIRTGAGLLTAAILMAIAPALHAQVTATISGTVTDPKGALVQGAAVTIIDEVTGSPRPAETNRDGVFSVPNLVPSTYTVKVVAQGFAPKELTGIDLHSGDEIRLPTFVLAIGQTTDTVTVTSVAGQILETENAQRSATLTYQDVQDLALTGRDTTELLKVLPGVVMAGVTASGTGQSGSSTGYNDLSVTTGNSAIGNGMGVNGAPYKGGTALNMDGASILDIGDDFSGLATINPEMTQEVQVLTSNFGADTSSGPVVINATGRSGGEHYHGEAYFDARNDAANANDWQDNHNGHPKNGAAYYYPGGSFSGPVPHTNKKLFFFGGMEYFAQNQGNANHVAVSIPTPEMLNGDFTTDNPDNLVMCPGGFYNNGGNIINGFTEGGWCQNIANTPTFNGPGGSAVPNPSYTIFADGTQAIASTNTVNPTSTTTNGGKIPSQYIDKNMLDFAKVWPAFNSQYVATTTQQITANGGYNYYQPIINHDNGWITRGRIDFNWNSTNQFYISYQQSYDSQLSGGCGAAFYSSCPNNGLQYPGGGLIKKTYSKVLNGHYVHIFSPTLTNEALASWVWGNIPILPGSNPSANFRSTLGFFAGCVYCGTNSPKYMPTFGGAQNGYPGISQADDWEPNNYYIVQKAVPTFADNLTKVWGRHTWKFGGMTSNTDNYQGNQSTNLQGSLTIGGNPTQQQNYFATQGTCSVCGSYAGFVGSFNTLANFLTGNLTNYAESNSSPLSDVAYQTIAFYADDSIKVNKQFTVEVGVRFEHIGWWYDREGVGLAVFYPQRVLSDFYSGKYAPGFYWHAIDGSLPLSGRPNRFGFLSPRVGLSYDVFGNGKTLVRGGWGAYRYQEAANGPQNALQTAQGVKNFSASSVLPPNRSFLLSQLGQLAGLAPNCQVACSQTGQTGYDPNDYGLPLNYAYNFTIDQRLPWNMLLDVGYVGNHAQHMSDNGQDGTSTGNFANQNKIPIGSFGQYSNGAWAGNADPFNGKVVCNPENLAAPCGNSGTTINSYDFTPFGRGIGCSNFGSTATQNPNCLIYGSNGVTMVQNVDYQNYNALQAAVVKRAGPVTLNANFTWSKSLGTVTNFDPFHVAPNNTYDNLNRPFVFNSSYIYREPNIWHGDRFIGGAVNGWTISGVTLWQKGPSVLPSLNVIYDPTTLPSYNAATGQQYASGSAQNPWGYSNSSSTLGVGGSTYFGTNAGITANSRPELNCNPKSGLVKYQLYRPCFVPAAFGQPGGQGLPFIAGTPFMENDLAIYKTFTVHEQNKVQFRISAFNWLNHPLPTFAGGESTGEYYFMNYQTHAIYANDSSTGSQAAANGAPGSPINATNVYATPGEKPADLFGQMHFKNGYGGNSQRIMEFDLKYTF